MTASNNHNRKPLFNTTQKKVNWFLWICGSEINQHSYLQVLMCLHDAHRYVRLNGKFAMTMHHASQQCEQMLIFHR